MIVCLEPYYARGLGYLDSTTSQGQIELIEPCLSGQQRGADAVNTSIMRLSLSLSLSFSLCKYKCVSLCVFVHGSMCEEGVQNH
jgi:hypothetical protein